MSISTLQHQYNPTNKSAQQLVLNYVSLTTNSNNHNTTTQLISNTTNNIDKSTLILYISKLLGYSVSIGSLVTKLPQVYKIYKSRNVYGLSLAMYGVETITQYISILYHIQNNYNISTYGENISFFVSNIIILILYYKYTNNRKTKKQVILWLILPLLMTTLYTQSKALTLLQSMNTPLYVISRLPQIYSNYKHANTGQLSSITFSANFIGSCIRIYTTATQLNNNHVLQTMFITSLVCNAVLLGQIYYYKDNTNKKTN